GPGRGIVKGGGIAEGNLLYLAPALLVAEVELVLARLVGEIGDLFAVGRPGRIALGDGGSVGQVADLALLGRQRQDLAVSLVNEERHRPVAVGKEVDLAADPHGVRIIGVLPWDFLDVGVGQIGDPDGGSGAAAVALPGHVEPGVGDEAAVGVGHVGEPAAVG